MHVLQIRDLQDEYVHPIALAAIRDEWASNRNYPTRVDNLRGVGTGPRANGNYFLKVSGTDQSVFDDAVADRFDDRGCPRDPRRC